MYSRFQLAKKYIHYWLTASNGKGHGIHSPFVFDFIKNVLNDVKSYDVYVKVEALRSRLLTDHSVLEVEDMGAGSTAGNRKQRSVADIARFALKPRKFGQLLFRIAKYYQPGLIIELGTSLGITTAYLALANESASVISLEGAKSVAAVAETGFRQLAVKNIRLEVGNFDEQLPKLLAGSEKVDLYFVDGNHRKEPTMRYFKILEDRINTSSIVIFDDIHWSAEMEEAWKIIKDHPAVTLSIDLFFIGLLFFRDDFKIKQHFTICF